MRTGKALSRTTALITLAIVCAMGAQSTDRAQFKPLEYDLSELKVVPPGKVPKHGTFWRLKKATAPLPFNPFALVHTNVQADVYALPNGAYLIDDWDVDYAALEPPPSGGSGGGAPPEDGPDLPNSVEFMAQACSLLNTNAVAQTDTNLYNALLLFPEDTNTTANLQILPYGTNSVIIRANHFDYSAETERDFALLICDKVETPLWKNIDFFGASDAQDGWLVQGLVPNWKVTDPMYFLVDNLNPDCNGFFRAIPYGGPQIQLTGAQPYDVVSNTVTLQATITDLSGVSNVQFSVTVDGAPARYTLGTNNTIHLDTKYNPNGIATVYVKAFNNAHVYDPTNPPSDTKLFFTGTAWLPMDFENNTYLLWASDYCPTEVVTNYIYYVINQPETISGSIFDPSDGHVVKTFGGYVPQAATLAVAWNFAEADGTTPYTNSSYAVNFQTVTTALTITNTIDREGVRPGAGCYLTYQEEDPFDLYYGPGNVYINDQARTWIKQTLKQLYLDLYKSLSLTQYTPAQVGTNRNHADCTAQDPSNVEWALFLRPALSNANYSDLTIAQAHGNGFQIGGGPFFLNRFTSYDLNSWVRAYEPQQNWRLRKAAIWTCWSAGNLDPVPGGLNFSFPQACGIRPNQDLSFMRKNCGLFFGGKIDAAWVSSGQVITTARAAEFFDQAWVCGKNQWPGACDPTYSILWAWGALVGQYPELNVAGGAQPLIAGFVFMPYSSVYDDELQMLDTSHVKNN